LNTDQFIAKSTLKFVETASFTWQTPSNIALVKYWGKSNPQIPKNASIESILLEKKSLMKSFLTYSLKENKKTNSSQKLQNFLRECNHIVLISWNMK
jgi:mevalonate pyrophosphate decarboxylase